MALKTYQISTIEQNYTVIANNIVLAIKIAIRKYKLKITDIFKAWETY